MKLLSLDEMCRIAAQETLKEANRWDATAYTRTNLAARENAKAVRAARQKKAKS